ncbi:MAG TPA: twin-arginine translocase subunit TatC [Propionicimonas sp.]|jgi:sec-independent protein translocase protein TatC
MSVLAGARRVWTVLRPPPATPDGSMSLYDHLRELRYRVIVVVVAVAATSSLAAVFYRPVLNVVLWPWDTALVTLKAWNPQVATQIVNRDISGPFMLALWVSVVTGVLAACPIWLYQLWKFIVPALLVHEKRYARNFLMSSIPLFLFGCVVGYMVLPAGISVMLQFTPEGLGIVNQLDLNSFLQLELLLSLLFGVSFLLPVILVMLNLAGVVTGRQLQKARAYSIFGCFVFGAVATPSTDPFSMTALALPMAIMYVVAEVICRRHDSLKAKKVDDADRELVLVD